MRVPLGADKDADRWRVSTAEALFARVPFRLGFLTGEPSWGTLVIDFAADYESHGLSSSRPCDYLCPDASGTLIRHTATEPCGWRSGDPGRPPDAQ